MSKKLISYIRPIATILMPVLVVGVVLGLAVYAQLNRNKGMILGRSASETVVLGETTGVITKLEELTFDEAELQTSLIISITNNTGKTIQIDPSDFSVYTQAGTATPITNSALKTMSHMTLKSGAMTASLLFSTPTKPQVLYFALPGEQVQTIYL